jgi:cell division septal protein FtsQ
MEDQPVKRKSDSADLRKYAAQTNFRLVVWFILILVFVGLGLVWIIYGRNAAMFGFLCLLGAGIPISLIALAIIGLDLFTKSSK